MYVHVWHANINIVLMLYAICLQACPNLQEVRVGVTIGVTLFCIYIYIILYSIILIAIMTISIVTA